MAMIEKNFLYQIIVNNKFEFVTAINPKWVIDKINYELFKSCVFCLRDKKILNAEILKGWLHISEYSDVQKRKLLSRLNEIETTVYIEPENMKQEMQDHFVSAKIANFNTHFKDKNSTVESQKELFFKLYKEINENIFFDESVNFHDVMQEYCKLLESGKENENDRFLKNSIRLRNDVLINVFGSWLRPWPIVVGAAPGMHKTSLLHNLFVDLQDYRGLVFSFEDTIDTFRSKYIAAENKINVERVVKNEYFEHEKKQILETRNKNRNVWIIDKFCDMIKFRQLVDKHIALYKINYIAVDYFQLFWGMKGMSKVDSFEIIAREFVEIRKEYEIPIIILTQLTEDDGAEPDLQSIKWCRALGEAARQVIFLYGDRETNIRSIKKAKGTFEGLRKFDIIFDSESQKVVRVCDVEKKY